MDQEEGLIAARLDRLPFTRTIWRYVFLISLGGTFDGPEGWRWVALIGAGGALIAWWLRLSLPESPFGPLLGMLVADRMERKWQIVCSGVGIGGFMMLFAQQTWPVAVIFFGVMVTLSNNWLSFTFHNYQAELYPTRIRARGVGFVYAWRRLSAAFAGLMIGFFLKLGGTMGVALFIGGAMVLMILTIGVFGPRTLGRRLEEISQ